MSDSMKRLRDKRFAHVRNPEPSWGWYAEVKDLLKRVDPESGEVSWKPGLGRQPGSGVWCVRLGGREAQFPFVKTCALERLYKDEPYRETPEGSVIKDLREDAIFRLVALMETHSI